MFSFLKESVLANQAASRFINEMAIIASDTFDQFYDIVIESLVTISNVDEVNDIELDLKLMWLMYFLMLTSLNAQAVNNIYDGREKEVLLKSIDDALVGSDVLSGEDEVIKKIYHLFTTEIIKGIESENVNVYSLPHNVVLGIFVREIELYKYDGVMNKVGKNEIISPYILMSIGGYLLNHASWWAEFHKKYKIL